MKKILISMFALLLLVSCTSNTYTLEGNAETPDLNGVTVYLKAFDGENWNDVANVTIENQKFILKGTIEEPTMAFLLLDDSEKQIQGDKAFILENGKIKFVIAEDLKITMSGSDMNNFLQDFEKELDAAIPQEFIDSLELSLLTEENFEERISYYTGKRNNMIADFAKENVNTLPGTFVFMKNYYYMSLEDRAAILDMMNEYTKNNADIQAIKKQVDAERNTVAGQKYTDFTMLDAEGNMLSLSDLVGKTDYLLIDFWASWCGPCIRSFPELTRFYEQNKEKGFEILGVSLDNEEGNWKRAIEKNKLTWKHVSDLKGWMSEAGQLYAVNSIPCTILLDKDGVIVGRNMSLNEITQLLN